MASISLFFPSTAASLQLVARDEARRPGDQAVSARLVRLRGSKAALALWTTLSVLLATALVLLPQQPGVSHRPDVRPGPPAVAADSAQPVIAPAVPREFNPAVPQALAQDEPTEIATPRVQEAPQPIDSVKPNQKAEPDAPVEALAATAVPAAPNVQETTAPVPPVAAQVRTVSSVAPAAPTVPAAPPPPAAPARQARGPLAPAPVHSSASVPAPAAPPPPQPTTPKGHFVPPKAQQSAAPPPAATPPKTTFTPPAP